MDIKSGIASLLTSIRARPSRAWRRWTREKCASQIAATKRSSGDLSKVLDEENAFPNQQSCNWLGARRFVTDRDFESNDQVASNGDKVSVPLKQCESGPAITVVPDTCIVYRGFQIEGKLPDAFESDDSRLLFNPGSIYESTEAPLWLIFDATLSTDRPNSLRLILKSQAGTPGLTGTLEAFNWISSLYDIVDVSLESCSIGTEVSVDLNSGIGKYVQAGTGAVRSRIGWRQTGFTINFPWEVRLDQLVWTVD